MIDFSEKQLLEFRKKIYLIMVNSINFEEAAHKILGLTIKPDWEIEICKMILESCMQERTFLKYYALLGVRFA